MDDVLNKIKKLSAIKGITIKELGLKAGVGENSIYRWAYSEPSISSLKKVAKVLEVDYKLLLP
ncbi:helix-turn-helix domain-containing protein [Ligilactobacillus salivarius]|uniref:helix-turn-helix domain-containing protein n=1 Tax=Ligilactobacillus salivarius TaxID=1624 RepID=UPI003995A92C